MVGIAQSTRGLDFLMVNNLRHSLLKLMKWGECDPPFGNVKITITKPQKRFFLNTKGNNGRPHSEILNNNWIKYDLLWLFFGAK